MSWSKFLFWSTMLSLPTVFFIPKKKPAPGVVEPGPEDEDGVVLEPSKPPEPLPKEEANVIPPAFQNAPKAPAGYARITDAQVPKILIGKLGPLLTGELGTVTKVPTDGRDLIAFVEPHFHPTGGALKPWGWHKGVTLYERKANA